MKNETKTGKEKEMKSWETLWSTYIESIKEVDKASEKLAYGNQEDMNQIAAAVDKRNRLYGRVIEAYPELEG